MAANGNFLAAARGGAIPSYDDGGSVDPTSTSTGGYHNTANTTYTPPAMADGGAIPDNADSFDDAQSSTPALDPETMLNASMDTLEYLRQKHGLGQGMNTDQMRPSTNVEDNRQGAGSIDTGLPVSKQQANQTTPNINGPGSQTPGATPYPYNGAAPVVGFKDGGSVQKLQDGGPPDDDSGGDTSPPDVGEEGDQQAAPEPQAPAPQAPAAPAQGAIPATPDSSVGAVNADQSGQATSSIMSYIMGQGAVPPQQFAAAKQQADPHNQMNDTQKTMAAIASAPDQDQAAALMQAARADYNASKAHAAAAITTGNLNVSVTDANRAYNNVPDGNHIMFSPGKDGASVDVNVSPIKGQPQQYHLTVPQYNQFLHGVGGQFDNLMEQDVSQVLNRLQQSAGKPVQQQAPRPSPASPQAAAGPTAPAYDQRANNPNADFGQGNNLVEMNTPTVRNAERTFTNAPGPATPGQANAYSKWHQAQMQRNQALGTNRYAPGPNGALMAQTMAPAGQPQYAGPSKFVDPFAEFPQGQVAAAQQMFPTNRAQQLSWLYGQKQQAAELQNKIEVAKNQRLYGTQATANERAQVGAARNAATIQAAQIKGQYDLLAKQAGNSPLAAQAKILSSMLANNIDLDTVNKQAAAMGLDWKAINARAMQAPVNAQPTQGNQPAQQPSRVINGVTYTKAADGKWYKQTAAQQ